MSNSNTILCIDWGTSAFRAALVKTTSQEVISSFQSDEGCKNVFQRSQTQQTDPLDFYLKTLARLLVKANMKDADYQEIIISGMASSSIGMKELPYATLPFSVDGTGVVSTVMETEELGKITLISGVSDAEDIIRGEETQLLGLKNYLDTVECMLILPGTHSKHLRVRDGNLVGFKTYLTGELFQLISEQSVVSRSMKKTEWSTAMESSFIKGVEDAHNTNLLNSIFRIRARDILSISKDANKNYFYLSGLMIGSELIDLKGTDKKKVFACNAHMRSLYEKSANHLELINSTFLPADALTNSYIQGQIAIIKHL